MGDNNFPFTNNDITKNQDSDNSDEELQLHNIYKETAVMEENPMLEKRKIGASKVNIKLAFSVQSIDPMKQIVVSIGKVAR